MGSPDPCKAEDDEVKRLTEEVWRLQRELNWVNDKRQGKLLDDLKAKEAAGEKGHQREIGEIESSITKLTREIQKAADALGEAEKKLAACREKQRETERQQAAQTGGGQTR
jgi:predicted RNase H-like nuclease (RuvC/YqgF family)